jgi:hypothetical protein
MLTPSIRADHPPLKGDALRFSQFTRCDEKLASVAFLHQCSEIPRLVVIHGAEPETWAAIREGPPPHCWRRHGRGGAALAVASRLVTG